jgi:septum formation protein
MKIILASKSPRRKELLIQAGYDIEIFHKEVDETYPNEIPLEKVAEYLAIKKANECAEVITSDKILLTADSIVLHKNKIYGKPTDFNDAYRILTELSGHTHKVITGVCLKTLNKEISFSGVSEVKFGLLAPNEIEHYINTCEPYDKAGSYGVQDWIGLCKIEYIKGTYTNIMGLPMNLVYENLLRFK